MLRARIEELRPWYHRIDFGGGVVTPAPRDQRIELDIMRRGMMEPLTGKTVLELGSNAGGLTKLLAEAGAVVTAVESGERQHRQAELVQAHFGYEACLVKDTAYNVAALGKFQIVVFHGLIYHLSPATDARLARASLHRTDLRLGAGVRFRRSDA